MAKIDIDQLLSMTEDLEVDSVTYRINYFDIDQLLERTSEW